MTLREALDSAMGRRKCWATSDTKSLDEMVSFLIEMAVRDGHEAGYDTAHNANIASTKAKEVGGCAVCCKGFPGTHYIAPGTSMVCDKCIEGLAHQTLRPIPHPTCFTCTHWESPAEWARRNPDEFDESPENGMCHENPRGDPSPASDWCSKHKTGR